MTGHVTGHVTILTRLPLVFSDKTCPNVIAGEILAKYMNTIVAMVDSNVRILHLLVEVSQIASLKSV